MSRRPSRTEAREMDGGLGSFHRVGTIRLQPGGQTMGYEDTKADVKEAMRNVDNKAKETWRKADGNESPSDTVANAGDDIRDTLGNAGDDLRRQTDDDLTDRPV